MPYRPDLFVAELKIQQDYGVCGVPWEITHRTNVPMGRHFSNWLKAYMEFTRDSESPTPFHFWTGVHALAGALRRRTWIDMRKFSWTPNFYIILVGPPGIAAKSTSISIGTRLLAKVPGIRFGPESMTWQALADSLAESMEYVKFLSSSGKEDQIAMSSVSIAVGELGTFLSMDDDKLLSFLIRMWEGQEDQFIHKTKTTGSIIVKNPWLNIIGATTPSWLRQNFPDYMIGGGLTSRIIFVYGDKKRQLVPYPDEMIKGDEYRDMEMRLFQDLEQVSKLAGPYRLDPLAREWGRQWYSRLHDGTRPDHMLSDRYSGYIARKQTHIHKMAIVLAAARRDELVILQSDLEEAESLISSIEPDMIRVFESIGVVDGSRHIVEMVAFVRTGGFHTPDDLWKRCVNTMTMRDFEDALKGAVRGGLLRVVQVNGVNGLVIATPSTTAPNVEPLRKAE
jgi:hypothetical protein